MWQRDPHLPISFSWEIWEMRAQITSTNENVRKRQFFVFAPSWASETYQKCYMKISKIVSLDVKNFFWRFSKTFSLLVMEKTLRFCIYNWFHDQYWKRVTVPRWNCRYPSTIATNYHYTASQGPDTLLYVNKVQPLHEIVKDQRESTRNWNFRLSQ